MSKRVENKLKGVGIGGDYIGGDQIVFQGDRKEKELAKEKEERKTTIFLSHRRKKEKLPFFFLIVGRMQK